MTIEEYIAEQPEDVQVILKKVHETIRAIAPDATEKIAWRMPSFWQGEYLIHFAAFKKHLGIFPGVIDNIPFKERFKGYATSKGAIQFPYSKPIDYQLIADIVAWRVETAAKK